MQINNYYIIIIILQMLVKVYDTTMKQNQRMTSREQ